MYKPALEIKVNDSWHVVDASTWSAWTGLRRFGGIDYHGSVFALGAKEQKPYVGARACPCPQCQKDCVATLRYN